MDGEDLADDTYLAVPVAVVASAVRESRRWPAWWPDLRLEMVQDRADEGVRWRVDGALRGTAEIWLEAVGDGTVVHFYLRAGLRDGARAARTRRWKQCVHALKDELEDGRTPGTPVRRLR